MVTQTNAVNIPQNDYKHLTITSDEKNNATWCVMNNDPKACFTQELLDELSASQRQFIEKKDHQFYVLASASKSIFSLGGDLVLFRQLIQQQNKQVLHQYMKQCIDTLYGITMLPACERIALVQGTAFGGGFEVALACDTIIAEKSATFGFPERLFNSFPGMGAYSYLVRRIEPVKAQKIIKSARTYSAAELYDMGIVDKLVPDGNGHDADDRRRVPAHHLLHDHHRLDAARARGARAAHGEVRQGRQAGPGRVASHPEHPVRWEDDHHAPGVLRPRDPRQPRESLQGSGGVVDRKSVV